jgi:hypothetical protein
LVDFRKERVYVDPLQKSIIRREVLDGDPYGYFIIDLKDKSEFHKIDTLNNKYKSRHCAVRR